MQRFILTNTMCHLFQDYRFHVCREPSCMTENQHLNKRQKMKHSVAQKTTTQRTVVMDADVPSRLALVESTNHNTIGQSANGGHSSLPLHFMKPMRYETNLCTRGEAEEAPLGWSQEAWEHQQCQNQKQQRTLRERIAAIMDIGANHQHDKRFNISDRDNENSSKKPSRQAKTATVAGLCNFSPIVLETISSSKNKERQVKKIQRTCTIQFARWRHKSKRQGNTVETQKNARRRRRAGRWSGFLSDGH